MRNIWVYIIILFIIAFGAWALLNTNNSAPGVTKTDTIELGKVKEGENIIVQENTTMEDAGIALQTGTYETYSPEKLAQADKGDVVLFFRASWCPTCRTLDKNINENLNNIPDTLTILDVDYDNSSDLKKKYGVTYQHTLVQVDSQGNMLKKWSGSSTLSSLISEII